MTPTGRPSQVCVSDPLRRNVETIRVDMADPGISRALRYTLDGFSVQGSIRRKRSCASGSPSQDAKCPRSWSGGMDWPAVLYERNGRPEYRFLFRDRRPRLPIWHDGQLTVVRWGNGARSEPRLAPNRLDMAQDDQGRRLAQLSGCSGRHPGQLRAGATRRLVPDRGGDSRPAGPG